MPKLFAYGTLTNEEVLTEVIGRPLSGQNDVLKGYRKTSITYNNVTYPAMLPAEGETVEGKVLDITEADLVPLDDYEGSKYKRIEVTLASGTTAFAYPIADGVTPDF